MFRLRPRTQASNLDFARGRPQFVTVASFNHDGLEIARVRSHRRWMPVWHFIFVVYMVLLIRLVVMIDIGPAAYANRIDQLESGTQIERLAARVMYLDPVSVEIANQARRSLRNLGYK